MTFWVVLNGKLKPSVKVNITNLAHFSGACPCSVNKTCEDANQSCNCDHLETKWFSDEGYYTEPGSLGIMNMYFLQQKELTEEAQGRITLGPLECVETSKLNARNITLIRQLCFWWS